MTAFSCTLLLILAIPGIAVHDHDQDACMASTLLLQNKLQVGEREGGGESSVPLPGLTPIGRTIYSNDPLGSAQWFMRYFGGHDHLWFMPSANTFSFNFTTATVSLQSDSGINSYMIQFVRGSAADDNMDAYAKVVEGDWYEKVIKKKGWSAWADMHDGLADYTFNLKHAHEDDLQFVRTGSVIRAYVPGTAWTLELKQATTLRPEGQDYSFRADALDLPYLEKHSWTIVEPCRNHDTFPQEYRQNDAALWWKATFAVANASTAAAFAIEVLGARGSPSPFSYPPSDTCSTGALWLTVGDGEVGRFELHFVELATYDYDAIVEYHQYHAKRVAALTAGCLDASLFDSVSFYVQNLDPFVAKLQSTGTPYMLAQTAPGRHILFFAFPGNEAIGIQLHSDMVTAKATVTSVEACAA